MVKYYLFVTKNGTVKKTDAVEYENIRQSGLIAVKLDKDDTLLSVKPTTGNDKVLLITAHGKSILFDEDDVRPTGRATTGVRGITIKNDDYVVGVDVITAEDEKSKNTEVLVLTSQGHGKRTKLDEYNLQGRGGQGVFTAKLNSKTGNLVAMRVLRNDPVEPVKAAKNGKDNESAENTEISSDLLVISKLGQTIRLPISDVPILGRHTQGVRIIRLNPNDEATALALI